jgi:hypothetical protein
VVLLWTARYLAPVVVLRKENSVLLHYYFLITSLSDFGTTSIKQWNTCVAGGRGICEAKSGGAVVTVFFLIISGFFTVEKGGMDNLLENE